MGWSPLLTLMTPPSGRYALVAAAPRFSIEAPSPRGRCFALICIAKPFAPKFPTVIQ